jgi:hypothetical protein
VTFVDDDILSASPLVVARDAIVDEEANAATTPVLHGRPQGGVASTAPVTVPFSASGIEATLATSPQHQAP